MCNKTVLAPEQLEGWREHGLKMFPRGKEAMCNKSHFSGMFRSYIPFPQQCAIE